MGTLTLAVYPYVEISSADRLLSLDTYQIESGSLEDLQQYLLLGCILKNGRSCGLKRIGRNLKDCRLWRDGVWLEDIKPSFSTYEPVNGRPMNYAEFYHDLNPGLYRLTFYGGAALAWADDPGASSPSSCVWGHRELGSSGRQDYHNLPPRSRDVRRTGEN